MKKISNNRAFFPAAVTLATLLVSVEGVAAPEITGYSGKLASGDVLVLEGTNFTSKKQGRPLFVWRADGGTSPLPVSRQGHWSGSLNGEITKELVAPNSKQSFRFDHGSSSGAALAGVSFDSNSLYVFRRDYEDFDLAKDFAVRTRVDNVKGEIIPGQIVKGAETGATGIVDSVRQGEKRDTVFYRKDVGSVRAANPTDFKYHEVMYTDTATFRNDEGSSDYPTGTYRTFNFKTLRLWNTQYNNNMYLGGGRNSKFNVSAEHTDQRFTADEMSTPLRQKPFQWKTEEVYYRASDINRTNGVFDFLVDGKKYYNKNFETRNTKRPGAYNKLYQSQVSNGAHPKAFIYYDTIYIDDSWNHVLACNEAKLSKCTQTAIQIPIQWNDESIKINFNYGALNKDESIYFYVFDKNGISNTNGYPACGDCPSPTSISLK